MTKRIQVMLDDATHAELEREGKTKGGITIGTVARWILGGWADKQRKEREIEQGEGKHYGG